MGFCASSGIHSNMESNPYAGMGSYPYSDTVLEENPLNGTNNSSGATSSRGSVMDSNRDIGEKSGEKSGKKSGIDPGRDVDMDGGTRSRIHSPTVRLV